MRVIVLASGAFAEPTLRWLANGPHEVPVLVTQPARAAGRGRKMTTTPAQAVASKLGFSTLAVEDVNQPTAFDEIARTGAHLGLVIAFGQKLGSRLLSLLPGGFINLHASLLPRYRGAAPIAWAIRRGEERTGCTVFRIVERMDAGPILSSRWTTIKPEETAGELHDRLAAIGVDAVDAALQLYDTNPCPPGEPQNDAEATRAPKLSKLDGIVDFACSAVDLTRHVRAMTPWPGASTRFRTRDGRWENVTLLRVRPAEAPGGEAMASGTIDLRRYVATGQGYLEILELKPSSGRVMTWPEYVNGRHVAAGDRFSSD